MGSKIRFVNACSKPHIFDIYQKDCKLCHDFSYFDYTDYHHIDHGNVVFKICPPKKQYSVLDAYTYVAENSYQTAVVTGLNGNLSFFLVPDAYFPLTYNKAFIRFVNLAHNTELDFTVHDHSLITFRNIQYKEATDYYPLITGTYDITARISNTNQPFLTLKNVNLVENRFYTIYVFGFTRDSSSPGYLLFADGVQ